MRIKILALLTGLFLFSNLTFAQSVGEYRVRKTETVTRKIEKPKKPKVVRENNPEREGFYAKCKASATFPLPNTELSIGYGFNNYFAIGIGGGIGFPGYSGVCGLISLDINGDLSNRKIINNFTLCYSIEPMIIFNRSGPYILRDAQFYLEPKIGLRSDNNYAIYLTLFGFSFNYKIKL